MYPPTEAVPADDRILPVTRAASLVIVAILVPALVVLWGLPGRTADLWAWTIHPDMTPVFMGSAYGAGAYFFLRVFLSREWNPASAGVLSAAAFAALMLIATLVHYDRFNHGDAPFLAAVAFYGWVGVYIASPLLVGVLWLVNQRDDPRTPAPGEAVVPEPVRWVARGVAAGGGLMAAVFLLAPQTAIDSWAWQLTPLTARVVGCFTAQVAVGALLLSLDARWSSWRLLLETFLVATVLLLAGAARTWDDFDHSSVVTWAFLAGLAGLGLAIGWLLRAMSIRGLAARRTVGAR
jgi:hypothetical protein